MATTRLGDHERGRTIADFNEIIGRAANNKVFPLDPENSWGFGLGLLPDGVRDKYIHLTVVEPSLVTKAGWNPTIVVADNINKWKIDLYGQAMPKDNMQVPETHPLYQPLIEWCEYHHQIIVDISTADSYLRKIVNACSSAGQIKRLMPPEVLTYLPAKLVLSFGNAERQSRIPRNFQIDKEKMEHFANMLAIGAMSPDKREGMQISLDFETL